MEVANETAPDLLKNTPSNIARLEDVIEHSKERHKYLAHTRSPSDGGDVRWYFCKLPLAPNELAASVPRSEIVGKGDYFRFGMRDSLAIEASFLQREEELLSSWWKEYAECSEGPKARPTSSNTMDLQMNAASAQIDQLHGSEEERVGVPVKGGLYEVDLVKRHCFPVYWNGENRRVLRGHWFARKGGLDWLPLREDVAEQLEIAYSNQIWHRRTFQPSGLFAARIDLQGSTPGLHALFTGEDDTWEAWLNMDTSGFSSIIGLSGNGIKLRRGYSVSDSAKPTQDELRQQKEEQMDDYCSKVPVRHVVFMVHGIGQRLEKSNLVDDVTDFRHTTTSLSERHLSLYQLNTQRVLFIPCQWRKGLKLSGETAVDKITLDGVRGLRVMLGATVHDVLYYMSPIYCQNIIDSVSNQLNRLYLKFLKRNPGYDGKVSIYGHSLGSVLSYDILCHQENLSSPFPMDWLYNEQQTRSTDSSLPHDISNQQPNDFVANQESNPSNIVDEAKGGIDPISNSNEINVIKEQADHISRSNQLRKAKGDIDTSDGEVISEHSTQLDEYGHTEEFSTVVTPSSLDFTELSAVSVDAKQTGTEEVDRLVFRDSSRILHEEKDCVGENISLKFENALGGLEKNVMKDDNHATDKDMKIKLLKEEIDFLKAKLADLESQCGVKDVGSSVLKDNTEACSIREATTSEKTPYDAPRSYTPYIRHTKLEFKVDTFYAVGSPLGVFLALRNIRIGIGKGQDYWTEENITEEMPACRQMFNIFHPFDPVAYRVEPLVCKECVTERPVIIPYHKGGKRLHIGFHEFTEDLSTRSQAIADYLNSVKGKVLTVCQSRKTNSLEEEAENVQEKEERTYGSIMMERLTGSKEGRIDHMLQDKTFEHPYLQAIAAHTNYWRDNDTALFILKHLYREIPEDIDLPNSATGDRTEEKTLPAGWSDHRENAEEELPLTFSDREAVRNLSRKARKSIRNA